MVLCFTQTFAQNPVIKESSKVKSKISLLETWIEETMNYYHIPGIALGIVYDQELIYSKGFGLSDLKSNKPVSDKTLFRIASISKLFMSTAIMQLRDEGKLQLDEPIKKYLKWFQIKNSFQDGPEVTIRQILTHSSGLPREAAFPYWTDHIFPTREQIIKTLPYQEMIFEPETKWKYSNLGISLLGEIIAEVSGISYGNYVEEFILKPLSMKDTRIQLNEKDKDKLALGYLRYFPDKEREIAPFTDSKGITAAANLSSNVVDLAKFISFQFVDLNSVLKRSTRREMHRVHWLRPSWESGWGLGFSISKTTDRVLVGHGGWVAGYRTQILFSPKEKVGIIVLMNTEDYSPFKIAKRVMNMVAPTILDAVLKEEKPIAYQPFWENYVGKYSDTSYWDTDVIIQNKRLYLYGYSLPPSEDPVSNLTELTYEGQSNTFRMPGEGGNGEKVVFEMENDKVKWIKIGENFVYPKED